MYLKQWTCTLHRKQSHLLETLNMDLKHFIQETVASHVHETVIMYFIVLLSCYFTKHKKPYLLIMEWGGTDVYSHVGVRVLKYTEIYIKVEH